jgi:hypothetical protein
MRAFAIWTSNSLVARQLAQGGLRELRLFDAMNSGSSLCCTGSMRSDGSEETNESLSFDPQPRSCVNNPSSS